MKRYKRKINYKDNRGYILDISYKEDFNHSALISSNKNSVKPDAQANYPSWSNYPDMRQTMSKIA